MLQRIRDHANRHGYLRSCERSGRGMQRCTYTPRKHILADSAVLIQVDMSSPTHRQQRIPRTFEISSQSPCGGCELRNYALCNTASAKAPWVSMITLISKRPSNLPM